MKIISENKCFSGKQLQCEHNSSSLSCDMQFSIYLPSSANKNNVPLLFWLSGLTCTDQNFVTKAGAQKYASEHNIAIVAPDTSPRGDDVHDVSDRYDLGKGAGFYVNAIQSPWSKNYQMFDYITYELPSLIFNSFPIDSERVSISGHSMGGHGALICSIKKHGFYRSVSAFSPICNPINSLWGQGCFSAYLGKDKTTWQLYDATELILNGADSLPLFIDIGTGDEFLSEQLLPKKLESACNDHNIPITLRLHDGYDHSYFFIASFIGDHISYHAEKLNSYLPI